MRSTLKRLVWQVRQALGLRPSRQSETVYRLTRLSQHSNGPGSLSFAWGEFQFVRAGQLKAQFDEIFVQRQYAFTAGTARPVIIDGGGNVGLSAIWFKLNYPGCLLTVYEADPDLADILQLNLERAGFSDANVRREAVWIENGTVSFQTTGGDTGKIDKSGSTTVPAIDLAERIPERVDLLKLDIEGAEFAVVDRLCQTGAMQRVQCLVCEFHVWRDRMDDLLQALTHLRTSGMQVALRAVIEPWIGLADEQAPFDVVGRNQVLVEVFAWRPGSSA